MEQDCTKVESVAMMLVNYDTSDNSRNKITNQIVERMQEVPGDNEKATEDSFFIKDFDKSDKDFDLYSENKIEKYVPSSSHVNTDIPSSRIFDRVHIFNSTESKNPPSKPLIKIDENNDGISSSKFSCAPNVIIQIVKLKSEVINSDIPVSEKGTESALSFKNCYNYNVDENNDSNDVMNDIQITITEETTHRNEATLSSPKIDSLSSYISAEEKKKRESSEQDILDDNIENMLLNENDEVKHKTGSTSINKDIPIENELKVIMPKEQCIKHNDFFHSKDPFYLHASKHKTVNDERTEAERVISTEIDNNERFLSSIDPEHCNVDEAILKKKIHGNTLNVLCADFDKPFLSCIESFDADVHLKEKRNSETTETITSDDKCFREYVHCVDSGDLVIINILKKESEVNATDNIGDRMDDKSDDKKYCNSYYSCHETDTALYAEKDENMIVKDESPYQVSDVTDKVSRKHESEGIMLKNKEAERKIACDVGNWKVMSPLSDCLHVEVAQCMQQDVKSEVIGKAHECENRKEGMLSKDTTEDGVICSLVENKESVHERDFYTSWQETISNCVSTLINFDIFGVRNYIKYISRSEKKTPSGVIDPVGDYDDAPFTNVYRSLNIEDEISNQKSFSTNHGHARKISTPQSCETTSYDIKTLEDALNYFNISTLMEQLESSLESVRRRRKTKEAHEIFLKDVDKQIQKLSFKFHPDRIRNKGGSEEEIKTAEKLQAAINAVRTAINVLNNAFLEDLDTDHRYGFYTKLELSSLANENELKNHVYEVIFQIGLLSELKHQKVIVEIQKFLVESQNCVQSYFDRNVCEFDKFRDSALFHLNCCTEGYKKLQNELVVIQNECKIEKLDNMNSAISRMSTENEKTLTLLSGLENVARKSLAGSFQIFTTSETLDDYFVLPFVCYVNVILLCNVMMKSEALRFNNALKSPSIDYKTFKFNGISFAHPYLLVSSFIDNEECEWLFKENMSKEELKRDFDRHLLCFNDYLKDTFKACNYVGGSVKNYLAEEIKKCMKMMFDFQEKEKELSKNLEKIKKKTEYIDEKYEKIMKENEDINKIIQEQVEKSKKLSERTSLALLDKFCME